MGRHVLAPRHSAAVPDLIQPLADLIRDTAGLPTTRTAPDLTPAPAAPEPNPEWADTPTWAQIVTGPLPPHNHHVNWRPLPDPDPDFTQRAHLVHVARTWQHAGGAL